MRVKKKWERRNVLIKTAKKKKLFHDLWFLSAAASLKLYDSTRSEDDTWWLKLKFTHIQAQKKCEAKKIMWYFWVCCWIFYTRTLYPAVFISLNRWILFKKNKKFRRCEYLLFEYFSQCWVEKTSWCLLFTSLRLGSLVWREAISWFQFNFNAHLVDICLFIVQNFIFFFEFSLLFYWKFKVRWGNIEKWFYYHKFHRHDKVMNSKFTTELMDFFCVLKILFEHEIE